MSIDSNLELNLGGDTGGIDLGQIQFPNRQARQILSGTSQARPNLGGVVLAQSGVPLQTAQPTGQQSVQVSTTSYTNVRHRLKTIVTFFNAPTGRNK